MPLAAGTLPVFVPSRAVPIDVGLQFCSAQALTATGYFNNIVGAGVNIDIGPGRKEMYWVFDISAMDLASANETYVLHLLGSNDSSWTNGAVEILCSADFAAATAGRLVPTICPPSDAVPPTGLTSGRFCLPFSNHKGQYVFRYIRMYLVAGGTTPSITLTSWLAPDVDD